MLNFSVVGVGSFGVKRAKAVQECKNAKLLSVCDKSSENANKAKSILNVDVKSFEEILKIKIFTLYVFVHLINFICP